MKKSFLTFLLMLFCLAGFAQQTVTGVILEEATSEPLAGAAVQVKDSQNGTIADADGRFSISVSPGQTLLISYIGLIPRRSRWPFPATVPSLTLCQGLSDQAKIWIRVSLL